jgi:hypothetical protein
MSPEHRAESATSTTSNVSNSNNSPGATGQDSNSSGTNNQSFRRYVAPPILGFEERKQRVGITEDLGKGLRADFSIGCRQRAARACEVSLLPPCPPRNHMINVSLTTVLHLHFRHAMREKYLHFLPFYSCSG